MTITAKQAASKLQVTKECILLAIKQKRLKAEKVKGIWEIENHDLSNYFNNRWDSSLRKFEGNPIISLYKSERSPKQAAAILNCPLQDVYYALRSGHLKSYRKESYWITTLDDIEEYRKLRKTAKRLAVKSRVKNGI